MSIIDILLAIFFFLFATSVALSGILGIVRQSNILIVF
jgi:hypothetical protein